MIPERIKGLLEQAEVWIAAFKKETYEESFQKYVEEYRPVWDMTAAVLFLGKVFRARIQRRHHQIVRIHIAVFLVNDDQPLLVEHKRDTAGVAVKEGGPDPANNFKLAQVIAKAKANNMPNDTIDRGIIYLYPHHIIQVRFHQKKQQHLLCCPGYLFISTQT